MSKHAPSQTDPDHIPTLLSKLRWWIRVYIIVEGLALAVVWLAVAFWVALAVDYLPVLLTATEFPWQVRAVVLTITILVLAFILYRWILRRAFVRLADHSMALLLERRYDKLQDGLVTSVEMSEHPDHATEFSDEMLRHTYDDALRQSSEVQIRKVFNPWPVAISFGGAVAFATTVGLFAYFFNDTFLLGASRLYLLEDQEWPRKAKIEVVGVEVQRRLPGRGDQFVPHLIPFSDGRAKVAKGSSIILKVRAEAGPDRDLPTVCTVIYETQDGDRGRQYMQQLGRVRDGYQHYSLDGKPLKGILSSLQFDVVGKDHRVRDYHIDVVDNPIVVATELDCEFPDYMVDEQSGAWTKRSMPWAVGTELPRGTRITVRARSNKPLEQVFIYNPSTDELASIEVSSGDRDAFSFPLTALQEDLTIEFFLHDTDDLMSDTPHRMMLGAIYDQPPAVSAVLKGIGTAVTPRVVIPIAGSIRDDYGVDRAWIDVDVTDAELYEHPLQLAKSGEIAGDIDFRQLGEDEELGLKLTPSPDHRLRLTVKALDHYALGDAANLGSGDQYELDIVTSDQLLAILEREEAGLRLRVEQIRDEMTEARDYLLRSRSAALNNENAGDEPGDREQLPTGSANASDADGNEAVRAAERAHSLRSLYADRSVLQTRKSAQEVLGVAEVFREIRQQLINNRIDAEDRKSRLQEEIADPLQRIGEETFADLELQIESLQTRLRALGQDLEDRKLAAEVDEAALASIDQAQRLLAELEEVLGKLIKFETYAELLDIVRDLIEDQGEIMDQTKDQQKQELLRGLFD